MFPSTGNLANPSRLSYVHRLRTDELNFYYTAKKNWKTVYNNKDELSDLCNKWEQWEPANKSRKNPVRTYWRRNEETKDDIEEEEQNEWWEQEQNMEYREDDEEPNFYWDKDLKKEAVLMIILIKKMMERKDSMSKYRTTRRC
jgi:hypothetical protein